MLYEHVMDVPFGRSFPILPLEEGTEVILWAAGGTNLPQDCRVVIETSFDNVNWVPVASGDVGSQNPVQTTANAVLFRRVRARCANGAVNNAPVGAQFSVLSTRPLMLEPR